MHRYGLIGRKLGHSFSKKHFTAVFRKAGLKDHRYDLYELPEIEALPDLLRRTPGLHGLNVTVPYKEAVIPFLDELDPLAAAVGAVNTIVVKDGRTQWDGVRNHQAAANMRAMIPFTSTQPGSSTQSWS